MCLLLWCIDSLDVLPVNQITQQNLERGLYTLKTGLSLQVIYYWQFQSGATVVVYYMVIVRLLSVSL